MRHSVTFDFDIGERVRVVPVNAEGRVVSLWYSDRGIRYEVAWWINGDHKGEYLFGYDLEAIPAENKRGRP